MELNKKAKHKASYWVFFGLYAFFAAFIVIQSSLPGSVSASQSEMIATIVAFFANLSDNGKTTEIIHPTSIALKAGSEGDTTYLPKVAGVPQIAVGTTTRLWFDVSYPFGKIGIADDSFAVTATKGSEAFSLVTDAGNHTVRIIPSAVYKGAMVSIKAGELDPYVYTFDAVSLPAPSSYTVSATKTNLKVNESAAISVLSATGQSQTDFLRYFDPSLLAVSSSDSSVLSLSSAGYVLAKKEGTATLTVGDKTIAFTIAGTMESPAGTVAIRHASGDVYLGDYGSSTETYSSRYEADVTLTNESDKTVAWSLLNNENGLKARIVETGVSTSGIPYCLVQGYREAGALTLQASLAAAPETKATLDIESLAVVPTSLSLLYASSTGKNVEKVALPSTLSVQKSTSVYLTGDFGNRIPTNSTLSVTSASSDVLVYGDKTSNITLSFPTTGTYAITIASLANPSLTVTTTFTVTPANVSAANGSFHVWVRKNIGHMGLFLCLGVFGYLFWRLFYLGAFKREWWKAVLTNLGIGFGVAALSEAIQRIPGLYRDGEWSDVGIDMLGFAIGALVTFLVFLIIYLIKQHKDKKKNAPTGPEEKA
jgi:VanZ family protein